MKTAICILLSLACLAYARQNHHKCTYSSLTEDENQQVNYDFSALSKFHDVKDQFGVNWTVSACPYRQTGNGFPTIISSAPTDESAVEIEIEFDLEIDLKRNVAQSNDDDDDSEGSHQGRKYWNQKGVVKGLSNLTLWNSSPEGMLKGAEVIFGSLTKCPSGNFYKTAINFVCVQNEEPMYSFVFDDHGCFTTIYVNSSKACPVIIDSESSDTEIITIGDDDDDSDEALLFPLSSYFWATVATVVVFCCCCVRCCIRRRKNRIQEQNKQFSNVAFQPIPASQFATAVSSVQMPIYNPYIQPAQQYYYYHDEISMPQPVADITANDEQIARELQARFNNEVRV